MSRVIGRFGTGVPLLVIAALAALLSIGMPWASALDLKWGVPYWRPQACYTVYDYHGYARVECPPMMISWGYGLQQSDHHVGYQHPVRVLAVAALVLLVVGFRRGRASYLRAGFVVAVAGLFTSRLHFYPGQVLWVIALLALGADLRRRGVLWRGGQPSRVSTLPATSRSRSSETAP